MKIPKTTPEQPYIRFRFNTKTGKLIKLEATSAWWGGKNSGYICTDGTEGNSCPPKQLDAYIQAYKKRKITSIEKEITKLQKQLINAKKIYQP
jgi:hypothetical protein